MIRFLAQAAKEFRENAEPKRKIIHIAVVADMDPSTVWRFEQGHWPRDVDALITAYATELELEPLEIWARALELWRGGEAHEDSDEIIRAAEDVVLDEARTTPSERAQPGRSARERRAAS